MELLLSCLIIGLFATTCLASVENYPPEGFFSSDATQITWAHGVNSIAKLESTLKDQSIKMLEADVVMGYVIGSTTRVPIMAHPPAVISDLSLLNFLNTVIAHNEDLNVTERKGIKLDYKEHVAFEFGMSFLLMAYNQIQFPVWNNADILPGPVGGSTDVKVNGTRMLPLHNYFIKRDLLTLSLGWTTRYVPDGRYSKDQLDAMLNLLIETNTTSHPVTFPLRAKLALGAVDEIKMFLDESSIAASSPSVTLWEGATDPKLTQEELTEFIAKIGKDRVFVDLPYSFGDGSGDDRTEEPGEGTDSTKGPGDDSSESTTTGGSGPGLKLVISYSMSSGFVLFLIMLNFLSM